MLNALATVAGIGGVFLTALGLLALAQQIRDTRRLTKAQFVSELENDLSSHYESYSKLLPNGPWSNEGPGPQSSEELANLILYLSFFGKLKFLLDLGALDISTVNRMFAFRFFLATHNRHVQDRILYSTLYDSYWSEVFALHSQWVDYRRSRKFPIPFKQTALELRNPERYEAALRTWRKDRGGVQRDARASLEAVRPPNSEPQADGDAAA